MLYPSLQQLVDYLREDCGLRTDQAVAEAIGVEGRSNTAATVNKWKLGRVGKTRFDYTLALLREAGALNEDVIARIAAKPIRIPPPMSEDEDVDEDESQAKDA